MAQTRAENGQNLCHLGGRNTSGETGVSIAPSGKWRAYVDAGGRHISLGRFTEKSDVIEAARAGRLTYHPNTQVKGDGPPPPDPSEVRLVEQCRPAYHRKKAA
jgi:hypothetical protein